MVPASRPSRQRSRQLSTGLTPAPSYSLARRAIVSRVTRSAGSGSRRSPRRQCAPDPTGKKQDECHEDDADHERPELDEQAEAIGQHQKGRCAYEGTEERPRASEQRHDDDLRGGGVVERLDGHDGEAERVERAGEPGERSGEDERQQLDPVDVVAARDGTIAVLADRLQHGAERRVQDALQGRDRQHNQRVGEEVEGQRVAERQGHARQRERLQRDAAQPVVAARQVGGVKGDEVEHLCEGECEHREIDTAPAQAEEPHQGASHHRRPEAEAEGDPQRRHLELGQGDAGSVRAEPLVGGVTEREEPGVAIEEVEAEGEEAEDQYLRRERLVGDEKRKDGEEQDEGGDGVRRHPGRQPAKRLSHHSARPASPNSPLGLTRSTTAITTKTTISASLGAKNVVRLTISPMSRPATMAPARLPMPPTTTTTKQSMMISTPISA